MHRADATENGGDGERQMPPEIFKPIGNLRDQFPRGGQHQNARATLGSRTRVLCHTVQQRQHERGRFTGAGLRHAEQIAPFQQEGNGLGLNGRGGGVACLGQGVLQGLRQGEIGKCDGWGHSRQRLRRSIRLRRVGHRVFGTGAFYGRAERASTRGWERVTAHAAQRRPPPLLCAE